MAIRQIRKYGDDILQKKAKPIQIFDSTLHRLLDDMWDTLRENDGLGLAAPQVGILRCVVVIELEEDIYEIINPKVLDSFGREVKSEACLSIPNKQGDVERPTYIKLEAKDRYGNPYVLETDDDMLTTALCHELDHLDGILFLDRAIRVQDRINDDLEKGRKNTPKKQKHTTPSGKNVIGRRVWR